MITPFHILRACSMLAASLVATFFLTGCTSCDLNNTHASARVVIASLGFNSPSTTDRFLEVTASGFHPNAAAHIKIPFMPTEFLAADYATESLDVPVTMDTKGSLDWRLDPVVQLWIDNDPDVDIFINVVEDVSHCSAPTSIKQQEFIKLQ